MADARPSRDGISLYPGVIRELQGKTINPGAIQVAMWEGLQLQWSYEPGDVVALHLLTRADNRETALRIPLTDNEIEIMRGLREKGGWGYYELAVEKDDDRAAAHVSFIAANGKPTSLLFILDRQHRTTLRKAFDDFLDEPIFDE